MKQLPKVGDRVRINDDANGSGSMAQGKTGRIFEVFKNVVYVTLDDGPTPEMHGLPPMGEVGENVLDLYEDEYIIIEEWSLVKAAASFVAGIIVLAAAGTVVIVIIDIIERILKGS